MNPPINAPIHLRFTISHWATWPDQLGIVDFATSAAQSAQLAAPSLPQMPALQRRRVEVLGRLALHVAYESVGDCMATALVFASRWGDISRSVDLIGQLGEGAMSPMSFSLSVHNAIAAQFSIARGDSTAYTTIAAGDATVEAAFVEALGQLADGVPSATIVYYDEPLPDPYRHFSRPAEFARAWACRLTLDDAGEFSVLPVDVDASDAACEDADQDAIPGDLAVLRFLRSGRQHLQRGVGNTCWRWQRHARPD